MLEPNASHLAPLPKSHYFLTISRGAGTRTFALRASLVHVSALILPVLALGGIGAALYFVFHDDLLASLMARQSQMQYAYEDRIDGLTGELDRQVRRQVVDQAVVERKMRDLASRELRLETRAEIVAGLANQAGMVRTAAVSPISVPAPALGAGRAGVVRFSAAQNPLFRDPGPMATLPAGLMGYAPVAATSLQPIAAPKPHPEAELGDAPAATTKLPGPLSALEDRHFPLPNRLSLLSTSLDHIEQVQVGTLARIGASARNEAGRLRGILEEAGLSPDRFHAAAPATGGPFVPLPEEKDTPFGHAMSDVRDTVGATALLRGAVERAPLAPPLHGALDVTSAFGPRIDPFLGRPALHPGVDLRESYGADIRATAAGRVIFAGPASGYGNLVEIDHGNGLTTRYAHMSDIAVALGETVVKGGVLGRVGATGRATGPHLHYEVRVDGSPVDPMRFLSAGTHLAKVATQ